jgi:hypothetical protein
VQVSARRTYKDPNEVGIREGDTVKVRVGWGEFRATVAAVYDMSADETHVKLMGDDGVFGIVGTDGEGMDCVIGVLA